MREDYHSWLCMNLGRCGEMVDAVDSKSTLSNKVLVRIRPSAFPINCPCKSFKLFSTKLLAINFFLAILVRMKEERLLALILKKKGFFEEILELSEGESSGSLSEWISVLEQKKTLLNCIEEIDAELYPFQQSLFTLSQEIADELDELRKVVQKILHLDTLNHEKRKQEFKSH